MLGAAASKLAQYAKYKQVGARACEVHPRSDAGWLTRATTGVARLLRVLKLSARHAR